MRLSSSKEIKYGAVLSYIILFASMVYGLFMTPYILKYVGETSYGVYKSVSSLSSTLSVIDFGLGSTMIRYISRYKATGEKEKENNFIAMLFLEFLGILALLTIVGIVFGLNISNIYHNTFNYEQVCLAKTLFVFLIVNLALSMTENLLFGIINGNEKFVVANSTKLTTLIIRIILLVVLLPIFNNVIVVVLIETIVVAANIVFYLFYCLQVLKIRPKLINWDNTLFKESFGYTILMFIQTLVLQFSGNVDNILIGSMISAVSVTIYSMALMIYNIYQNLSGTVANLMLPRITNLVVKNAKPGELQYEVVKFGRFQFFLLAAALGGLTVLGKDFFYLWLGETYHDCYALSLILVVSVTLPTIGNVALSIIRAQNKMVYRTVTVIISCIMNIIITIIGITFWGYWGAAIGTASASIFNFFAMNIYYHYKLGFHIKRLLYDICFKTCICTIISSVIVYFAKSMFITMTWPVFFLLCVIFIIVYGILLFLFSMSRYEKNMILGFAFGKRKE